MEAGVRLLVLLLAWTTFAFAGVYLSSLIGSALLTAGATPSFRDPIDAAALAALGVIAFQLMPLPAAAHDLLSPQGGAYRAAKALDVDTRAWAPLSLDPRRTRARVEVERHGRAIGAALRREQIVRGRGQRHQLKGDDG